MTAQARFALTYSSWADLNWGSALPLEDIASRFATYSLDVVLGVLQRIDLLLWHEGRPDATLQDFIGSGLFGQREWTGLLARLPQPDGQPAGQARAFFFFHQQIQNAVKVALLVCPDTGPDRPPLTLLGEALLGLTDHLDPYGPGGKGSLTPEELAVHVTLNAIFNENERQLTTLPVGASLYLESHRDLSGDPQYIDFPSLLKTSLGVSAEDVLVAGIALTSFFQGQDTATFAQGVSCIDKGKFFSSTFYTPGQIDSFFRISTRSAADFRTVVRSTYSLANLRPFHFTPFAETPLLDFDGKVFCVSFKFLVRRFSTDLHFYYVQHLSDADKRQYFIFHGKVFEAVCRHLFGSLTQRERRQATTPPLLKHVDLDADAPDWDGGKKADGILHSKTAAAVYDAKAGRLTSLAWDGDLQAFNKYIDDLVIKAATQIANTISGLRSGSLKVKGLQPQGVQRWYPIVVSLQYLGWNHSLAASINQRLQSLGLLQDSDVAPLQVIELGALHILAGNRASPGNDLLSLLSEKTRTPFSAGLPFNNFLVSLGPRISWRTPELRRRLDDLFQKARAALRPEFRDPAG